MTATTLATPVPRRDRAVAGLAFLQTALFLVPMAVLGTAIGWPASLRLPAAEALPLIQANASAVLVGYWAYLLVSVALIPLAFSLRAWFAERGLAGWPMDALAFVGAAAGVLKTLGIVRWLSVMPLLAERHAASDGPVKAQVGLTYAALNGYAGAVGELLGVQLMSGLWLVGTGAALVAVGRRSLGVAGSLVGLLFLATCLRTAFPTAAALQGIAAPLALAWFVALGIGVARRRPVSP